MNRQKDIALLLLFGTLVVICAIGLVANLNATERAIEQSSATSTDSPIMSTQFMARNFRYVSDLQNGDEACTGYDALAVLPDGSLRIDRNAFVSPYDIWHQTILACLIHIRREQGRIVVFANSIRDHTWIPSQDESWYLPAVLRQ